MYIRGRRSTKKKFTRKKKLHIDAVKKKNLVFELKSVKTILKFRKFKVDGQTDRRSYAYIQHTTEWSIMVGFFLF